MTGTWPTRDGGDTIKVVFELFPQVMMSPIWIRWLS